jgi:4a-hydroxytetrahydrobiopterin dehydratase
MTTAVAATTVRQNPPVPEGWTLQQSSYNGFEGEPEQQWLHTRKDFNDFIEAWAFANKVALLAEKRKHHPDMTVGYNYVELRLTTHAAGQRLTPADFKLASDINQTSEMKSKLRVMFEDERHRAQVEEILGHPIPDYEPGPTLRDKQKAYVWGGE